MQFSKMLCLSILSVTTGTFCKPKVEIKYSVVAQDEAMVNALCNDRMYKEIESICSKYEIELSKEEMEKAVLDQEFTFGLDKTTKMTLLMVESDKVCYNNG